MSFVALARSKALVRAGIATAARMMMIATTTSISIKVKAREYLFFIWGNLFETDTILDLTGSESEKEH
jgi:hypothetical protein